MLESCLQYQNTLLSVVLEVLHFDSKTIVGQWYFTFGPYHHAKIRWVDFLAYFSEDFFCDNVALSY